MRRSLLITFVVIMVCVIALAYADQKGTMNLKVGDEVYACNCGMTANAIQWQTTSAIVLAETQW